MLMFCLEDWEGWAPCAPLGYAIVYMGVGCLYAWFCGAIFFTRNFHATTTSFIAAVCFPFKDCFVVLRHCGKNTLTTTELFYEMVT